MNKTKPSKISTAVILAAGMGIRLREVIGLCPKGLLEINGESLIMRSLQLLGKEGIERVIIVTGFQEFLYHKYLKNNKKLPKIEFVHSPRYAESGSMHSLFMTKDYLKEDFLLLESDLLYESRALKLLLDFERPEAVLASGKTGSGDEVYIFGENIENFSSFETKSSISCGEIKAISKQSHRKLSIKGELVGISKISQKFFNLMCSHHEANLIFPLNYHYEECISEICSQNKILYLRINDLVWTEIDNQVHYDRAIKYIYPKLLK
tara:strand:+ start:2106 stop:2900 length:795 start_codon:yes stop_codon:yes gene_type:complete